MHAKYKNEDEILRVVGAFENGTIKRDEWKHAEHLLVGLYYLSHDDLPEATRRMREGIFNLLKAFEVDLGKEMPYHETITVFWMRTVEDFRRRKNGASLVEIANELVGAFDKDYPLKFYSRELLFSEEARARFVEPDLSVLEET